jgi:hypothetical protein
MIVPCKVGARNGQEGHDELFGFMTYVTGCVRTSVTRELVKVLG